MAWRDGTGPFGAGPLTGRGLGPCGTGLGADLGFESVVILYVPFATAILGGMLASATRRNAMLGFAIGGAAGLAGLLLLQKSLEAATADLAPVPVPEPVQEKPEDVAQVSPKPWWQVPVPVMY